MKLNTLFMVFLLLLAPMAVTSVMAEEGGDTGDDRVVAHERDAQAMNKAQLIDSMQDRTAEKREATRTRAVEHRDATKDRVAERHDAAKDRMEASKDRMMDRKEAAKERVAEAKTRVRKQMQDVKTHTREVAKDRLMQAKERRDAAKDRYQERKEAYKDRRDQFKSKRDELRDCTENCDELRDEVHEHAQRALINAIETVMGHVERMAAHVEGSEHLSDEEVDRILAYLDEVDERLDNLMDKAEAAESGQDVRAVAHELNSIVRELKAKSAKFITREQGQNMGQLLRRADAFGQQLECTVDAGADLDMDVYWDAFEAVELDLEAARAAYADADTAGAREHLADARQGFRELIKIGKELASDAREQGYRLATCDVEVEAEVEFTEEDIEEDIEKEESEEEYMDDEGTESEEEMEKESEGSDDSTDDTETENEMEDETEEESSDDNSTDEETP